MDGADKDGSSSIFACGPTICDAAPLDRGAAGTTMGKPVRVIVIVPTGTYRAGARGPGAAWPAPCRFSSATRLPPTSESRASGRIGNGAAGILTLAIAVEDPAATSSPFACVLGIADAQVQR